MSFEGERNAGRGSDVTPRPSEIVLLLPLYDDWPADLVRADNRVTLAISDPAPKRAEDGVKEIGIRVDWIALE